MKIIELVKSAHENAVNKGWWQEERTYGELIALVHSEVSEALEDYRAGSRLNKVWYQHKERGYSVVRFNEDYKPCGIPSELADVCIRIFDIAGKYGWAEGMQRELDGILNSPISKWYEELNFIEKLTLLHHELSSSWNGDEDGPRQSWLVEAIYNVMVIAKENGIDLDAAIAEKMAYNATRPQRHGGKVI